MRRCNAMSLAAALLAGCAAEPIAPEAPATESSINLTAFTAGTTIATLVVEVTAADIPTPLVFNLVVDDLTGVASGTVRVPHGDARVFSLTAYDATGAITHEGQTTIAVSPGPNPPLQISLGPRSGQVPLTVTFGSYSVIVLPGSVELDLEGVATIQLTVQVLDQNGQAVADLSGLQWATSAPAVAMVDAGGMLTGLMAGSASIVATYEGVAGLSIVTVVGSGGPDLDEDGFPSDSDCDDSRSDVYPGAAESLDGVDNDCDGAVDENFVAVISEVMADASMVSDTEGEWIEIYNAGSEALNPTGWILGIVGGASCVLPSTGDVPPGGYLVVGHNPDPIMNGGIAGMVTCPVALTNGAPLELYLAVPLQNLESIDFVTFADPATAGASRSLDLDQRTAVANDSPANWCLATTPYGAGDLGTPGADNPQCP